METTPVEPTSNGVEEARTRNRRIARADHFQSVTIHDRWSPSWRVTWVGIDGQGYQASHQEADGELVTRVIRTDNEYQQDTGVWDLDANANVLEIVANGFDPGA